MMRALLPAALFLGCSLFGYWVATQSWGGSLFVYLGEERSPSSVRRSEDYSVLDRRALTRSATEQLLSDLQLKPENGSLGVWLGHPLIHRDFACTVNGRPGLYDRIELTFYGQGISQHGDMPMLVVESDCMSGTSLDRLAPLWVPMTDILNTPPQDQEINVPSQPPAFVRLLNIPGEWPEEWVLWSVRLIDSEASQDDWVLDAAALRTAAQGNLPTFTWKLPAAAQ